MNWDNLASYSFFVIVVFFVNSHRILCTISIHGMYTSSNLFLFGQLSLISHVLIATDRQSPQLSTSPTFNHFNSHAKMPKAEAGSTKAIANASRRKGLGRLRWVNPNPTLNEHWTPRTTSCEWRGSLFLRYWTILMKPCDFIDGTAKHAKNNVPTKMDLNVTFKANHMFDKWCL